MRRLLGVLAFIFVMSFSVPAFADDALSLEAKVNGKMEAGENIDIAIYAGNVKNLYAADIMLEFDPGILQMTGIQRGSLITKSGVGSFEQKRMPGDDRNPNNIVRYIFTCTGASDGYSGDGPIVTFKAKVLKKADFFINSKPFIKSVSNYYNLKADLCDKTLSSFLDYKFTSYGNVPPESTQNSSESSGSSAAVTNGTSTSSSSAGGNSTLKSGLSNGTKANGGKGSASTASAESAAGEANSTGSSSAGTGAQSEKKTGTGVMAGKNTPWYLAALAGVAAAGGAFIYYRRKHM